MLATQALEADLLAGYARLVARRQRSRRIVRVSALATAAALMLAGAAYGAAVLLGWPAPAHVKQDLAAVDQGMPSDLRLNPDVERARAVAASGDATLYAASLRDGGSCSELVTDGDRGRGATCETAADEAARPIELVAPSDDQAGTAAPVVLGGRVTAPSAHTLEAHYADGSTDAVDLGIDGYFVFIVPAAHQESVHTSGLELIAYDDAGAVVARAKLPADWDGPAVPDEQAPLYVSTRSDDADFTKVYGVEGHVSVPGAVKLELAYADGSSASIPLAPDGTFDFTIPDDHIGDFMQPRLLRALDAEGNTVASKEVAAVAYWRRVNRSSP
jgi:hypothetical protein